MNTLEKAQSLVKSGQNFADLVEPTLVYLSKMANLPRAYTYLKLTEENEVVNTHFGTSLENLLNDMKSDEYQDIEIMSYPDFYAKETEAQRKALNVGVPKQVSKARFWEMLEMLYPAEWENIRGAEYFRYAECITDDLYYFFFRIGKNYFEMVNHRKADLAKMIEACLSLPLVEIRDEEEEAA